MVEPKEINIEMSGYTCKADFYDVGKPEHTVLYLIGFTSTKESYKNLVTRVLDKTDMNAVVLDYTGHGVSPFDLNDCTQSMHLSEAIRAYDWIAENYPEATISVIGTSYGGYFAALTAGYRKVRKLIMRVPGAYKWDWFYTKWKDLYTEDERIAHRQDSAIVLNNPLLIESSRVHGGESYLLTHSEDTICPKVSTDAFGELFNAENWVAEGFVHGFADSNPSVEQMDEYQSKIAEWLKK